MKTILRGFNVALVIGLGAFHLGCQTQTASRASYYQQMFDTLGPREYARWASARLGGYAYVPSQGTASSTASSQGTRRRSGASIREIEAQMQRTDEQLQRTEAAIAELEALRPRTTTTTYTPSYLGGYNGDDGSRITPNFLGGFDVTR